MDKRSEQIPLVPHETTVEIPGKQIHLAPREGVMEALIELIHLVLRETITATPGGQTHSALPEEAMAQLVEQIHSARFGVTNT